jgi:hypothetical protein
MSKIVDTSNYFVRMNHADLSARSIGTPSAYAKLYKDSILEFTTREKDLIIKLTEQVDKYTDNTKRLQKIPWKFVKMHHDIENGWPHTLGDVIVLSGRFFQLSEHDKCMTLLHEKMHVFQRIYPLETHMLINKYWKYSVMDVFDKIQLARNNPDINNFVYGKDGTKYFQKYKVDSPSEINESHVVKMTSDGKIEHASHDDLKLPNVVGQYEHPYEIMGSFFPKIMIENYNDDSPFTSTTKAWISKYL